MNLEQLYLCIYGMVLASCQRIFRTLSIKPSCAVLNMPSWNMANSVVIINTSSSITRKHRLFVKTKKCRSDAASGGNSRTFEIPFPRGISCYAIFYGNFSFIKLLKFRPKSEGIFHVTNYHKCYLHKKLWFFIRKFRIEIISLL